MLHFYKTPGLLPLLTGALTWSVPTDEKELYLTFDDGPIPGLTNYVLDLLDKYEAKATFFCVGDNIRKYPHIASDLVSGGHLIGNHTFNHLKGWSTSTRSYAENVEKCSKQIAEVQQLQATKLFRPPHGQLSRKQVRVLKKDYKIIMWDVLAYDFDLGHSSQRSLQKMIRSTEKGSIIVFHDNYKAEEKLKYMLPRFLAHFREQGFIFKKLDFDGPLSKHN